MLIDNLCNTYRIIPIKATGVPGCYDVNIPPCSIRIGITGSVHQANLRHKMKMVECHAIDSLSLTSCLLAISSHDNVEDGSGCIRLSKDKND